LNKLLDDGNYVPPQDVQEMCERKTLFEWLEKRFALGRTGFNLTLLDSSVRKEMNDAFADMVGGEEYGVKNNGLCLLIAYAQEQIQVEARELEA
jgi:hypothetical protein